MKNVNWFNLGITAAIIFSLFFALTSSWIYYGIAVVLTLFFFFTEKAEFNMGFYAGIIIGGFFVTYWSTNNPFMHTFNTWLMYCILMLGASIIIHLPWNKILQIRREEK